MANHDEVQAAATEIAKHIPKSAIDAIVVRVLTETFSRFSNVWGSQDRELTVLRDLVKEAVIERARELLKTKYKDDVEKQAEILAAGAVRRMADASFRG